MAGPPNAARTQETLAVRGPTAADRAKLDEILATLPELDKPQLLLRWRNHLGGTGPAHLPTWLLSRLLAYRLQTAAFGDLWPATLHQVRNAVSADTKHVATPFANRSPATREGLDLRPGALLAREWRGQLARVTVLESGFAWNGATYGSLSQVAKAITGTNWNGHRFFGLRANGNNSSIGRRASSPPLLAPRRMRTAGTKP